jgi:hypothetical protein
MGNIVGFRMAHDLFDGVVAGNDDRFAAKPLRQPHGIGNPISLFLAESQRPRGFHVKCHPRRPQPVGHAPRVAHKRFPAGPLVDAHHHPVACRPRA